MIYEQLLDAVNRRVRVWIYYSGSLRLVEPHLIGQNTAGNMALSAFQVSGGSGSEFRSYLIDRIESVEPTEEIFDVRPGYNPNDRTMVVIRARV